MRTHSRRKLSTLVLVCTWSWAQAARTSTLPGPQDVDEGYVSLEVAMLPSAIRDTELLRLLNELSEHDIAQIDEDENVASFLRDVYGFYNEPLWELFQEYNPGLSIEADSGRVREATSVVLPVAPRWRASQNIFVSPGSTISQAARQYMGTSGSQTIDDIEELNERWAGNWKKLPYDEPVTLPWITMPTRVRARIGPNEEREDVLARVTAIMDAWEPPAPGIEANFLSAVRPLRDVRYEAEFEVVPHQEVASAGACTNAPDGWPWQPSTAPNGTALPGLLGGLDATSLERLLPGGSATIVAVIDSGIPRRDFDLDKLRNLDLESYLEELKNGSLRFFFWKNRAELEGGPGNNDAANCVDDFIGCNLLTHDSRRNDPFPDESASGPRQQALQPRHPRSRNHRRTRALVEAPSFRRRADPSHDREGR